MSIPIVIEGRTYGHIATQNDVKEFIVKRSYQHLYRSCPCMKHIKCEGFTVSKQAVELAEKEGAVVLKVIFQPSELNYKEIYVTSIKRIKESPITFDNKGYPQYTMPLHEFVKLD